jgi:ribosomal protein L37AE/L43A
MPKTPSCPECHGPLNEARGSDHKTCRLCNAEVALRTLGEDSEDDAPACPACDGPGVPLGKLSKLTHYRCRNCGAVFSAEED